MVSTNDILDEKLLTTREKYKEEFEQSLMDFVKLSDSDYTNLIPKPQHHICRIFLFKVINTDENTKAIFVTSDKKNNIKLADVIPLVKILKLGDTDRKDLVEGGIYVVPSLDVVGKRANLGYRAQLDMKSYNASGEELKIAGGADALAEKVLAIETNWAKFLFPRPWVLRPEDKDMETYLLPELKLLARWDSSQ